MKQDIEDGKALSKAPLPAWVFEGSVPGKGGGVHRPEGSWSAQHAPFRGAQHLAGVCAPGVPRQRSQGPTLRHAAEVRNRGSSRTTRVRVWTLDDEVLIASITAKLHLISPAVTEGLMKAIELAETSYRGLVIWSPDDVFSAGANLEALMPVFMQGGAKAIQPEEKKLQDAMLRIRYAGVPVVAAVRGMAPRRRLRAGHPLRAPRRGDGKLHGFSSRSAWA